MADNISQWIATGSQHCFWGMWNDAQTYVRGASTTDVAQGAQSNFALMKGIVNVPLTIPGAEALDFPGDNGSVGSMIVKPVGTISANLVARINDNVFAAAAQDAAVKVDGPYDEMAGNISGLSFGSLAFVINSPAQSSESGSVGAAGWEVVELLMVNAHDIGGPNIQSRTPRDYLRNLILSERDVRFTGESIEIADLGMTKAFWVRYWSPYPITYIAYEGDGGAAQTVTLPYTPAAETGDAIQVDNDGVRQVITTDWTVSGTTLTFVGTDPAAGISSIIRMQIADGQLS